MADEVQQLDINEVVASLVARTAQGLGQTLLGGGKSVLDEARVRLGSAFTRYLDEQLKRRSQIRTLLYRDAPQFIYNFYVPQDLQFRNDDVLKNVGAVSLLSRAKHCVIVGMAGMGKSTLLRHLFVDFAKTTNHVPLFIELKGVNPNGQTLESLIEAELSLPSLNLAPGAIKRAFEKGQFVLLLDGFDEVNLEKQDAVSTAIQRLANENPALPILVTSRPDDRFIGWVGFSSVTVLPLSLEKVRTLIARIEYDEGTKIRFLADIESTLWQTHQSFLSNPLLLTIMLITYSHNASVPSRMHLFYSQVFETLWNRHDALKDGYKRTLSSNLEKDDFVAMLEAFAFKTYWDAKTTLTLQEVDETLAFALKVARVPGDRSKCLEDLVRALCILNRDGLHISYTHRSFQEYYAARFLLRASPDQRGKLIERVVKNSSRADQVLQLMWEMDKALVERELLIPKLSELEESLKGKSGDDRLVAFTSFWAQRLTIVNTVNRGALLLHTAKQPEAPIFDFVSTHYRKAEWEKIKETFGKRNADEVSRGILARRHDDNGNLEIDAADFEGNREIIRELAGVRFHHSTEAMDLLLRILDDMRREHKERSVSLDELFS
ncbi:MAG TPA: NACHT domain-containing protein [Phycisphaerales bacterium]|nr:NACHT domain-containing protein [Phycisphaerales bacterium]